MRDATDYESNTKVKVNDMFSGIRSPFYGLFALISIANCVLW